MHKRSLNPDLLAKQLGDGAGNAGREPGAAFPWPDTCGEFDIRIDRSGTWFYMGSPIGRLALVRLFSRVLRRDDQGDYWLVTPVEAGRIQVDDVPFTGVEVNAAGSAADPVVTVRTNLDDIVTLDAEHPLILRLDPESGDPVPYFTVRDGLEARLLRSAWYHLVDLAEETGDGGHRRWGVRSAGCFFPLEAEGGGR